MSETTAASEETLVALLGEELRFAIEQLDKHAQAMLAALLREREQEAETLREALRAQEREAEYQRLAREVGESEAYFRVYRSAAADREAM